MIVAAGLTPAWQQIMRFEKFQPGEVNRAAEVHWCASGKVLNVAVALAHLGAEHEALALLGGLPRQWIDREFDELGVNRRWIDSRSATRICTTVLDRATGRTTELVENARPVATSELEAFAESCISATSRARLLVLTGSLPGGTPRTFFGELIARIACPAILDVRGPELLSCLKHRPLVVKPNREELVQTLDMTSQDDSDIWSAMSALNERGAAWAVVTDGKNPVRVSGERRRYRLAPPPVEVVNPIGSGDCLAAGLAWGLTGGKPFLDALRLGVAAASENAAQVLPGRLNPERLVGLAEEITVEQV